MAARARNLLQNGMGGIDWSGLPLVCAYLGVTQIEPFIDALQVLLTYEPPNDGAKD